MAAVTQLGATFNTTAGNHTVTATPAVNDLIVLVLANTGYSAATAPTDNNADGLGAYTLAQTNVKNASGDRIDVWVRNAKVGSATSTTFTGPGTGSSGGGLFVLKVTGMTKAGSAAVRQAAGASNVAGASAPTTTWGGAALTGNPIVIAVFNATSPAGVSAPSTGTWSSLSNVGYSTPTTGAKVMSLDSGWTSATVTWGSTTTAYANVAVELDTSTATTFNQSLTATAVAVTGAVIKRANKFLHAGSGGIDANTVLALHGDDADASTTLIDSSPSGHPMTALGNAQIDTAQSKFGGSSMLFDGTGDYYTTPDHTDFALGSGDFTIDCWLRFNALGTTIIAAQWAGTGNQRGWELFYFSASNLLRFVPSTDGTNPGTNNRDFAWTPSTNTWYHLAVVRTGNNIMAFVDGTQIGSTQSFTFTLFDSTAAFAVGADSEGGAGWNGWIDEFRLSKGVARWTSNFTPPTRAYQPEGGSSILGSMVATFVAGVIVQALTATTVVVSGTMVRRVNKGVTAAAVAVTGAFTKRVNKALTATGVVVTGSMTAIRVFLRTLTATPVAVTGTMVRQANKILSASSVVTGSMLKRVNKALTATAVAVTSTLAAIKVILRTLTATPVVVTGTMTEAVTRVKALTATAVVVTGSIVKRVNKALTATSVAVTGSVRKQVNKTLAASSAATATLVAIRLKLLTMVATVVVNATITKRVNKSLTAAVAVTASITKPFARALTAVVTTVASLVAEKIVIPVLNCITPGTIPLSATGVGVLSAVCVSPGVIALTCITPSGLTLVCITPGGISLSETLILHGN